MPTAVAIIPDKNRTYARNRGLPPEEGHRIGFSALKNLLPHMWSSDREYAISHLVFWALSSDNLRKREKSELDALKALLKQGIHELQGSPDFNKHDIRLCIAGNLRRGHFSSELSSMIEDAQAKTAARKGPVLTLLIAYDGREELIAMVDRIRREKPWPELLTESDLQKRFWTRHLPDIDLVIRTGESDPHWTHTSGNFLPWQFRNAEIYSTPTYWPAFTPEEFDRAMRGFQTRNRRFGA